LPISNNCTSGFESIRMSEPQKIPLFFPGQSSLQNKTITVLGGDVGGTKTNLALYKAANQKLELIQEATYHSATYNSCIEILAQFLQELALAGKPAPYRICLGVAGPVVLGRVEITNLSWTLDIEEIRKASGISDVFLINDLEATAYGLAGLGADDLITIHDTGVDHKGNIAILAPGTGLGEAGLFWDGSFYHPFSTEGGHTDFAPRTEMDIELCRFLQKKYGIVSWERVIAGPAIHDIYQFLMEIKKRSQPAWLKEALLQQDPSAVISQTALEEKDQTCMETLQLFVRYLARESSNLALKMKATGGLYLGGGIPPKISSLLQYNVFYDNFLDCDRMQHLLKNIPIRIILNSNTALLGAGYFAAFG
jgi:glucokinase